MIGAEIFLKVLKENIERTGEENDLEAVRSVFFHLRPGGGGDSRRDLGVETGGGQIRDPVIRSSTNRIFNRPSLSVVQSRLQCQGQGQDVRVQAPIVFKIR